jgi:O-antigen ligase
MVALCVGVLIWFFRTRSTAAPRLRAAAIVAAIGIGVFASVSVWNELHQTSGRHTSITVRSEVERQTRDLWKHHPWTGVGLRFFKTPRFAGYQAPNNVNDEIEAEAGVFGVFGFVVFVGGALLGVGRVSGALATAGLCVISGRFAHGLFDIYWTGGTTALPWIVAGMGLASAGVLSSDSPATKAESGTSL